MHTSRGLVDNVQHNHTYHLPAESTGAMQRPVSRDKMKNRKTEEHLTRDEKRARALNVPMSVHDIINLPMDEFNERLSKYDLNEPQLTLIRDIRRRGKNKVNTQYLTYITLCYVKIFNFLYIITIFLGCCTELSQT